MVESELMVRAKSVNNYLVYIAGFLFFNVLSIGINILTEGLWYVRNFDRDLIDHITVLVDINMTIILLQRINAYGGILLPVAMGCLGMGIVDGFDTIVLHGQKTFLINSVSGLWGAILFASIWFPWFGDENKTAWKKISPWLVGGLSILIGILGVKLEQTFSVATNKEVLIAISITMHIMTGVLFYAAAARLFVYFQHNRIRSVSLLISIAVLFGMDDLTFAYSLLFDTSWWLFYFYTPVADALMLGFVLFQWRDIENKLRDNNDMLQREIAERERTQELLSRSEEQYRFLLTNIPQKVFYKDREGRYIAVNPAFAADFNLTPAEMKGRTAFDFFPEHLAEQYHSDDIRMMESGSTNSYDTIYIKDGKEYVIHAVLSPVRDDNGVVIGMLGIIWDITDRKHAEDALKREKETAQKYLDVAGVIIVILRLDQTVELINKKGCDVLGYQESDIVGKNWFDNYPPSREREYGRAAFNACLTGDLVEHFEGRVITRDGHERLISWHLDKIYDSNGILVSFMGAGEDITQRRMIETQLMIAMREADSANSAKSEFLANMSHEIRTPLNGIVGLGRLMLQTDISAKQRDYLNKIQSSSSSLLVLINDLLDLSKIEAGKLELEIIDFDLNSVLDNIVTMLTMRAEEKAVEIMLSVARDVPFLLCGDPLRITQVMTNLLSNAIKFTANGEIIVAVKVSEIDDKEVTLSFSVKDTGTGIKPDVIPNLFKPFSQGDSSTTRKYGGTGLGLSICKKLVELMGGVISVKSEYGKGSEFTFTLRIGYRQPPKTSYLLPPDLIGMRVMVVDDNTSAREILKDILEGFTMDVTTVDRGMAAIEQLRCTSETPTEQQYRLLLMDMKMPGMDGLETARHIQIDAKIPNQPVIIMVTAHGNDDLRQKARAMGIRFFLTKPVKKSTLFNSILEAFGKEAGLQAKRSENGKSEFRKLSSIRGARILLVEDHYINQQVAFEVLTEAGFVVEIANNGLEAVKMATNGYNVVLMDIQMPEMDGIEATRRIREGFTKEELPIIAMTAHVLEEERTKCYAAGMNDHVSKPIDITELCQTLLKWIQPTAQEVPEIPPISQVEARPTTTDSLPGIDMASGLKRLGGNIKLLQKVIIDFRTSNLTIADDIEAAIHARDYKSARDLVHGLKGMAGNISATVLFAVVKELEDLIMKEADQEISQCLERVSGELQIVFESASTLEMLKRESEPLAADTSVDVNELYAIVARLQRLLEQNSLQVREYLAENRSSLTSASNEREIDELSSYIDKLDFKGAMSIVKGLAESLSVTDKEKILIVDDKITNIEITNETLRYSYITYFATNARDAFKIALEVRPDLILLDIIMPDISGYDLCRQFKNEPSLADVPVIFITSMNQEDDEAVGLSLGAVDYISKPINPAVFKLRVKNHLMLKKQMLQERQLVQQLTKVNEVILNENIERRRIENALKYSEHKYRQLFELSHAGIWAIDRDGLTKIVNPRMSEMVGYAIEEIKQTRLCEYMKKSWADVFDTSLKRLRVDMVPQQFELELLRKGGTVMYVAVVLSPVIDKDGAYAGAMAGMVDITTLKELERQLLRSQKDYYSNILNSMHETLIVVTQEAIIETVNVTTCNLLGYTEKELIGEKIDIICNIDLHALADEMIYKTKSGVKIPMLLSLSSCTSVIDNSAVMIIIGRDITEQKNKDRLFLMKMRQAQMGEMLSLIAHQWRQPLAAINAIIGTLKVRMAMNKLSEVDIGEGFDKIERHVLFLSQTINDFRNFYKTNKRLEPTLLHDVIEKALNIVAIPLKDNNVQVTYDKKISSPFQTYPGELIQVFLNLFSNSMEAIKERKIANPQIKIIEDEDNDYIYVKVIDNGGGFSDYVLENVFTQYYSTKGEAKGTGLGLYICKVIINDNMKGHIEASNVDDCACMGIKIPKQFNKEDESV
ncbi:multi-sensor hybrid histidine kinase [Candidatus Magnetobacterium bavaricum]|uniref:Sensory/regulatory protein RpfC n=1 Tax=Candidatus Magnetobacterium bavaricum TaxID=29290 RepID=A0A0F3GX43_9BACT|nr:multi-sensor hybrid histidine kinase [Candidatus Magnetobacterium bavaricum]